MKRLLLLSLAGLGLALAAGCGEDDPCAGHSHDPVCLVCEGNEDPIPSTVEGDSGNLSIEIASSTPSPLENVNNTIVVHVLDGATRVEGATITATPWYPPGGHGTPVIAQVEETAAGEYTITDVNFIHQGVWELRFDVTAGSVTDHVVFTLCIALAST